MGEQAFIKTQKAPPPKQASFTEIQFAYHPSGTVKVYNPMVLIYSQPCAALTAINFGTFSAPLQETSYQLAVLLVFPNTPVLGKHQSTLFLWICLLASFMVSLARSP